MKKALLVATVQSHIAQFHRPLIKVLKESGYEIHVAARDNLDEKNGLMIKNVDRIYNIPFQRNPIDSRNLQAYQKLKALLQIEKYDFISCNTPVGGVLARLAASHVRKQGTRVYYTAHGFHFYKGAPRFNWIIYYPIEKYMAHYTDTLVTITKEDYILAKSNFRTNVVHIHGVGADDKKFLSVTPEQVQQFRIDQGYNGKFVVLCVGELNKNKNQKTVIDAIKKVTESHPEIILLVAGNGPLEQKLKMQVETLELQNHVQMLGYCVDLEKYTNACDVLVSASFREGMPLNIIEGMMCKKPVVASYNRGHKELIVDEKTGFLFEASNSKDLAKYIELCIEDGELRQQLGQNGYHHVKPYLSRNVEKELRKVYNL